MYNIIVNPASKSGKGKRIWEEVKEVLEENKIEYRVFFTKKSKDGIRCAKRLIAENTNKPVKLIVLGGDGTMNEVVQEIRSFDKIELAYIPTGSSNDLNRSLGNKKSTRERLLEILKSSRIREMDIGKVTMFNEKGGVIGEKRFVVSSGVGFDAAVCEEALHSRMKETLNRMGLGKLTYLGIALKYLLTIRAVPCRIVLDESQELSLGQFLFVACMNHPYEGGGFKFCPKADCADGWLDVCILGEMPKWKMLFALPAAFFGKHVIFRDVYIKRAKKVSVTLKNPLFVHTDGEVPGKAVRIEWELLEEKLRFML